MGEPAVRTRGNEITIEHLTASLARVEDWCRAVRLALDSIPDKESIRFPASTAPEPFLAKQPLRAGVCPPPQPQPKQKPGKCPPPQRDPK